MYGSRTYFVRLPLLALWLSGYAASAQPQSRISFCLKLAQELEAKAFEETKQYITKEDDLRKQLTSTCAQLRYEFSPKSEGGFRVIADQNGDTWSIDEKRELIQIASKDDVKHSSLGPTDAKGKPLGAAYGTGSQSHRLLADSAGMKRMQKCFAKNQFRTEGCRNLFDELEKKCPHNDILLARLCLELETQLASVDLLECVTPPDDIWGKCALRQKQLEKKCTNQLRQSSSECRGLQKYLAAVNPPAGKPEEKRAPASAGSQQERVVDSSQAKTLESSLRTLLRLRPVTYYSKSSKTQEMGFVPDEVESVSTMLVSHSPNGQLEGVKYNQLAALMTSGLQELYTMCRAEGDLHKDMVRRMTALEGENAALKNENAEFKKQISNLVNDLQTIKNKLGLK